MISQRGGVVQQVKGEESCTTSQRGR